MQGKRMQGESAKQVAIHVLRTAGEALHTKEITKRVIESGRSSGLKAKDARGNGCGDARCRIEAGRLV